MSIAARSVFTRATGSYDVGCQTARRIRETLECPPEIVLAYLTLNHDQPEFLRGMRDLLGNEVRILGCSAQGVMGLGATSEEGYVAGALGLGGEGVEIVAGHVEEIALQTFEKGVALGRTMTDRLSGKPKVAVLHYDPLCGADMDVFLAGLDSVLQCPIVGGASSHFHGPMRKTFQYFDGEVMSHGAVAFALSGQVTPELAITCGGSPVGLEMTVTKSDGPVLLELDGRPALEVWQEITSAGPPHADHTAALAVGVPAEGPSEPGEYLMRAAFGVDAKRGGVVLQVGIRQGAKVMLHHRTVEGVLEGTRRMGATLRGRLQGKTIRAVLGFECGARTVPFLGAESTRIENGLLQQTVAERAEWIGLLCWGEIYPVGGRTGFHNYTYPLLALTD